MSTEEAQKGKVNRERNWRVAGILTLVPFLAIILAILFFVYIYNKINIPFEVALPLFVIVSVAGLISLLAIVAVIFAALNLGDPSQALSLPRGTVRAIIALSLIIIFAVVAIFLYSDMASSASTVSQESVRFAQQILTTVSTLVVSIASFYFGTRAVETARDAVEPVTLRVLSPVSPAKLGIEKGKKLAPIEVEAMPRGEAITWEIIGDTDGSLAQVKTYEFEYIRGSSPADTVILRFALVKNPAITRELTVLVDEGSSG